MNRITEPRFEFLFLELKVIDFSVHHFGIFPSFHDKNLIFSSTILPGLEGTSLIYEITMHVAFVHAFVNPTLFLVMYKDLRKNGNRSSCCGSFCCCCLCEEPDNHISLPSGGLPPNGRILSREAGPMIPFMPASHSSFNPYNSPRM